MQQVAKYFFIVVLCFGLAGFVFAGFYLRTARKAATKKEFGSALAYRTLAIGRVIVAFMDLAAGAVGYWLVTNYEFTWMGLGFLLWLVAPSGFVLIFFTKRAAKIRRQHQEVEA